MPATTRCRLVGALILVATTGLAHADTIQVKLQKLGFVPAEITAHVGDTIEWVNSDFVPYRHRARRRLGYLIPVNGKKTGEFSRPRERLNITANSIRT